MIKILFFAANPAGTSMLQLDEEVRCIGDSIRRSQGRDEIDLKSSWAVRPDDLLQVLNEYRPQIVHFSGHGSKDDNLILVQDDGKAKPVGTDAIKFLFKTLKDDIRVVLFNACFSRAHAEATTEIIDCAIGMKKAIGDAAAIKFASAFYRALGFGRSVTNAFDQGKAALMLDGIKEEETPELFSRAGVNPVDVVLLPSDQTGSRPATDRGGGPTPPVQLVDAVWAHQELIGRFHESVSSLDRALHPSRFPTLDLKLKSTGNGTAFLNAITLAVLEARVDPEPHIVASLYQDWDDNSLRIRLRNLGWGKACDVSFTPLPPHVMRHLSAPFDSFTWQGEIEDSVELQIPASAIRFDTLTKVHQIKETWYGDGSGPLVFIGQDFDGAEIVGNLTFRDEEGTSYHRLVSYPQPSASSWLLYLTNHGFVTKVHHICESYMSTSYTYDIELYPDRGTYKSRHAISQRIAPGDVDRFELQLYSARSAFYKVQFTIEVDGTESLVLPPMSVHIVNLRDDELPRASRRKVLHRKRENKYARY
jgi:hypothetical protein